jgi:hypothetical protein
MCQHPSCGSEILVLTSSEIEEGQGLRCSCGATMKKVYVRPQVTLCDAGEAVMQTRHSEDLTTVKVTKYLK